MRGKTSVVIPYYQDKPGILRNAIRSAVAQDDVTELEIIVVDDCSPASARDDLQGLDPPAHVTLKLIEQPIRAGPGAARNRALDSVTSDTDYVALLDSDDYWVSSHLRNAHRALRTGYDLYFADLAYADSGDTFFARMGIDLSQQIRIDDERHFYRLVSDVRRQAINSVNPFPTPCVVYRWEKFKNLRYPEIAFMGEDLTFWMDIAGQTNNIVFRAAVECLSGPGIHIYENSGWATQKAIWRIYEYMKWRKWLQSNHLKTELERQDNGREIKRLRKAFITALLHEIRRMRAFRNPDVLRFLLLDPKVAFDLVPITVRVVLDKLGSRRPMS